ncbi:MAG: hypothetical protein M1481_05435 [Candidatus Thermoplasmatota archaeon]|jgi:hypothetical protein|nr:hypothetical protein [Candidatus Thermoplasmatota archaeon]
MPMVVSDSRSVAHLNGINIDHTNQSNLNRFISVCDKRRRERDDNRGTKKSKNIERET